MGQTFKNTTFRFVKATGGSKVEKLFFASWQTTYYLTLAHHAYSPPPPPPPPHLKMGQTFENTAFRFLSFLLWASSDRNQTFSTAIVSYAIYS